MAFDAYLDIEGIPGESLAKGREKKIELLSFDFGATQATSATASSAGGASAERVNLKEFTVRKFIDMATPKIFQSCCSGQHIKKVTLHVQRAGGTNTLEYLTVTLEEVIISSTEVEGFSQASQNGQTGSTDLAQDIPTEKVKFNFARITVKYNQQKRSDGGQSGNVSGGWDRSKNKPISG